MSDKRCLGQSGDFGVLPLRDDSPSRIDLLGFSDVVAVIESTITREDLGPMSFVRREVGWVS